MSNLLKTLAIVSLLSASNIVLAGDPVAGEEKAKSAGCAGCHGVDGTGAGIPANPILAGQYEDYLIQSLEDYKSGTRKNPVMSGMSAALSEEDIENLAAWFASQESLNILPKDPIDK